jgi:uncharacterized protein YwgA
MVNDYEKLVAIFKYLNLRLNNPTLDDNFRERLIIQKIAFISQSLGIAMGYDFNLYKKGPYCPRLTDDYYNNPEAIMFFRTEVQLAAYEIKRLNKISEIIFSHPIYFKYHTDLLQAISTILYFKDNDPKLFSDDLFRLTKTSKPYLSDRIVMVGLNLVKMLKP